MTMQKRQQGIHQAHLLTTAFGVLIALSCFISTSTAQSTDRDNPTPITSREISDTTGDSAKNYFYSFVAGPGEVKMTVDLKSTGSALINVDVLDNNNISLSSFTLQAAGDDKQLVKRIQLKRRQPLTLRIGNVPLGATGEYRVRLDGAVQLAGAESPASVGQNSVLNVPNQGTLRIELDDGTTQEVNLSRVRRILIQK